MARQRVGPWAAIDKTTGSWIGKIGLDELEDLTALEIRVHHAPGANLLTVARRLLDRLDAGAGGPA
jgi:hypothetical protein